MVFLRLTVKVYPREQLSAAFTPASSLGEGAGRKGHGIATKPVSFLMVLQRPEEVTLAILAGLIQEKWLKLRPNAG
jgi:hypothetical protein